VHEGIKSSLVAAEVIAYSVELTMRRPGYDAMVGLAGCDKSLPRSDDAMVTAQLRRSLCNGRLDPARTLQGKGVTIGDVFEGVGASHAAI